MNTLPAKSKPHHLKAARKPVIPDHEVLRCIGRGSYGEVWLARGVTGALRAVKVVRREDFEQDRTFEREFQGILSFEPISRDHPGLVDILHVGRNDQEGFYYYVMELADDRELGNRIDPVSYEPRTLGTDKQRQKRLPPDTVVEIGIVLADALAHLHDRGLSHRDIKPSNIIFVAGKAKLADIGLVAQSGQRTYVGTEGFVPPEGPGTSQADIYSLGMVLYEVSTGKDRLQFPELPEDHTSNGNRARARMLNEVICKACDPNPKRRFHSAKALSDALKSVRRGKYKRPILPRMAALTAVSCLLGFGVVWARNGAPPWPPGSPQTARSDRPTKPELNKLKTTVKVGTLRLESEPAGAEIWRGQKLLGKTPFDVAELPVGRHIFTLKREGFLDARVEEIVEANELKRSFEILRPAPPQPGKPWRNSLGMAFVPEAASHRSEQLVSYEDYRNLTGFDPDNVLDGNAVRISRQDAQTFCEKLLAADIAKGLLTRGEFVYRPQAVTVDVGEDFSEDTQDHIAFHCLLQRLEFGSLIIHSDPPGAVVLRDGDEIGYTPHTIENLETGTVSFVVRMLGYDDQTLTGEVTSGKQLVLTAQLVKSRQAVLGVAYENSLGMKFVPVRDAMTATDLLVSVWETRVKDYAAFTTATGLENHTVAYEQTPDHPVARINREEAQRFCQWLTQKERTEGLLPPYLEYRLPTDQEWSIAADLHEEANRATPAMRNQAKRGIYVWGAGTKGWPPPKDKAQMPGNFSDLTRARIDEDAKRSKTPIVIQVNKKNYDYDDGFAYTAPVGSFAPNKFGLYDLAGNVGEWVSDNFGEHPRSSEAKNAELRDYGVTRGGSWSSNGDDGSLLSSARNAVKADLRDGSFGFRCVIAKVPPQS